MIFLFSILLLVILLRGQLHTLVILDKLVINYTKYRKFIKLFPNIYLKFL